ncbi:MAG: FAD binding domain-containing protein [Myxococcota bacterium]|nr:FAD binding domain-containing protein [Myxococcota bacterium]
MSESFRLNGERVSIDGIAPTMTVLEWLRANGKAGTKEGCAEGDCGACTIALLDDGPEGPTWRAVCSCIMLLPQVFGREIVTVEGLAEGGRLHPAQSALVDALGSQCGYCTPGFVMSLFEATYRDDLDAPWKKDDQICGNLCRCTGYRPIRDALDEVSGRRPSDRFSAALSHDVPVPPVDYAVGNQRFVRPNDWPTLWRSLKTPKARIVTGATDLGLDVTQRHIHFECLVDLSALPGIRSIEALEDGAWRIGAGARLADIETWAPSHHPALGKMLRFFASRQIKNRATIGGNLCNASPIGDLPPVMLALDAVAICRSESGIRRIPFGGRDLGEFWLSYRQTALQRGEILAAVEIPMPHPATYVSAYKVSKRRELDISAVAGAFALRLDEHGQVEHVRLAYGGMAATPARARRTERSLMGKALTQANLMQARTALASDFSPIDDHRGSAWYRMRVATNLFDGFIDEVLQGTPVGLPDRPTGTVFVWGEP